MMLLHDTDMDKETRQVLDLLETFMIREMGPVDADRAMQVVISLMERARLMGELEILSRTTGSPSSALH